MYEGSANMEHLRQNKFWFEKILDIKSSFFASFRFSSHLNMNWLKTLLKHHKASSDKAMLKHSLQ